MSSPTTKWRVRSTTLPALVALLAAACGTTLPPAAPSPSTAPPTSVAPTAQVSPSPSPKPTGLPTYTADASISAGGVFFSSEDDAFQLYAESHGMAVSIAEATIDFGDGAGTAAATGSCGDQPSFMTVNHDYAVGGDFAVRLVSVRLCRPDYVAEIGPPIHVHVLASASAPSASWPTCSTYQLHLSSVDEGAGLGHGAVMIRLKNVSEHGCNLTGYPSIQLVSPTGHLLPTDVHQATDGDYMFPAIAVHRVALRPGATAAFAIGVTHNPTGPLIDAPYDLACPPIVAIRVVLPGTRGFGTARLAEAPCNGWVNVSPVYPGAVWVEFP